MNLTPRQKQILEFIQSYLEQTGTAPTVNEIRDHFRLGSLATVHKHLQALEYRGALKRDPRRARAMDIIPLHALPGVEIPLLGLIAAGQPITALENPDTLSIPEDMLGRRETYALKVTGNSMIGDGIHDGDFLIIESRSSAEEGEIVVALIGGTDTTVKRYFRERGRIRLQPSNESMKPIYVSEEELMIRGVVIGLIRKYQR